MKVAFHFDADHERFDRYDGLPVIREIFRQLLQQETANLHLKVFTGDIAALDYLRDKKNREEIWRGFFTPPRPVWQSLRPDFMDLLYNKKVFVVAFEGMGSSLRDRLHEAMLNDETYLGAQQIHEANPVHWVLYGASLVPLYRITGRDLRLFYSIGSDDQKDQALAVSFRDDLPFSSIYFEEMAVPHTILDSYSSYEHASRVANLSVKLYDHLNLVADQVMLRLTDLAPGLYDKMYEALIRFEDLENPGGPARAAQGCREMLEALAGRLSFSGNGGSAVTAGYIDVIKEAVTCRPDSGERELLLAQLRDICLRINRLEETGRDVRDSDFLMEGGRLIMGLITFVCDVILPDSAGS